MWAVCGAVGLGGGVCGAVVLWRCMCGVVGLCAWGCVCAVEEKKKL